MGNLIENFYQLNEDLEENRVRQDKVEIKTITQRVNVGKALGNKVFRVTFEFTDFNECNNKGDNITAIRIIKITRLGDEVVLNLLKPEYFTKIYQELHKVLNNR